MRSENFKKQLVDYLPQIRRVVSKIAQDEGVVDDLTQECCVRIIEKEELLKDQNKFRQWVNALSRNLTINSLAKERSKKKENVLLEEELAAPEDKEFSEEHIRWVIQQFTTLPEMQKKVLQMKYFQGMKSVEIAKELNISKPTVTIHSQRAIKTLKKRAKIQGLLGVLLPWNWNFEEVFGGIIVASKQQKVAALIGIGIGLVTGVAGLKVIEPASESAYFDERVNELNLAIAKLESENIKLIQANKKLLGASSHQMNQIQEMSLAPIVKNQPLKQDEKEEQDIVPQVDKSAQDEKASKEILFYDVWVEKAEALKHSYPPGRPHPDVDLKEYVDFVEKVVDLERETRNEAIELKLGELAKELGIKESIKRDVLDILMKEVNEIEKAFIQWYQKIPEPSNKNPFYETGISTQSFQAETMPSIREKYTGLFKAYLTDKQFKEFDGWLRQFGFTHPYGKEYGNFEMCFSPVLGGWTSVKKDASSN